MIKSPEITFNYVLARFGDRLLFVNMDDDRNEMSRLLSVR